MKKIILIIIVVLLSTQISLAATSSCLRFQYVLGLRSEDETTKGEVSKLQQFLKNQGYYKADISGYYGKSTALAVLEFQRVNRIPIDINPWSSAIVGPKTSAKIASITCPVVNIKATNTPTPTPTATKTSTPTLTATPSATATYTATPSYTYTSTPSVTTTPSSTYTPTYSATPTYTSTPTYSSSPSPSYSPTYSPSYSPSSSPTSFHSNTRNIGAVVLDSIASFFNY